MSVNGDVARHEMWAGRIERCLTSGMVIGERCALNKVSKSSLFVIDYVFQPGGYQRERRFLVGEHADDADSAADLSVGALDGVVRPDPGPVLHGEVGVWASVSAQFSRTTLAAAPSFIDSSESATSDAFASDASRDSCAWTALSILATLVRFYLDTLPNMLRRKRTVHRWW